MLDELEKGIVVVGKMNDEVSIVIVSLAVCDVEVFDVEGLE